MTKLERFEITKGGREEKFQNYIEEPETRADMLAAQKVKRDAFVNKILNDEVNLVDAKDFLNAVEYLQGDDVDGVIGRKLVAQISQAANHEDRAVRIAKAVEEFKKTWYHLHPQEKPEEESRELPRAA